MSYARRHRRWFRRMTLGLALASVVCAGRVSAAANDGGKADDEQIRIEHARDAQAQGGLSGYLTEVAEALVGPNQSPNDPVKRQQGYRDDAPMDVEWMRIEHARDAQAQGLFGYPSTEQVWTDRE